MYGIGEGGGGGGGGGVVKAITRTASAVKKKKNQQAVLTKFETIILGVMFYIYHSNDLFWKIFSLENETWKGLKCFPVLSCLEFSTRITNKKSKTNFRIV